MILDDRQTHWEPDLPRLALQVRAATGKSLAEQRSEIESLAEAPNMLLAGEYYYYRLYDDGCYAASEKRKFLGRRVQQKLVASISGRWGGIVHDKLVFQTLLSAYGFPMPPVIATYDAHRSAPGAAILRASEDVARFLRSEEHYPLFGKPIDGMFSLGTVRLDDYERRSDTLGLANHVRVAVDPFVAELARYRERGYLFQRAERPDPGIAAVCGNRLACVRLVTLMDPDAPSLFRVVWKVPAGPNVADNFWRDGNLLADIDAQTGTVMRVVSGVGLEQQQIERHPDTDAKMIGFAIPHWSTVKQLCRDAAQVIAGVSMQAWDVAVCDRGPVIIEANVGGAFNLPQLAAGAGLLDERFTRFLHQNGMS